MRASLFLSLSQRLRFSAYQNEDDIQTALQSVIPNMRNFIEVRNGVYWVPNPVNPEENFADRRQTEPEKADAFFQWLKESLD